MRGEEVSREARQELRSIRRSHDVLDRNEAGSASTPGMAKGSEASFAWHSRSQPEAVAATVAKPRPPAGNAQSLGQRRLGKGSLPSARKQSYEVKPAMLCKREHLAR